MPSLPSLHVSHRSHASAISSFFALEYHLRVCCVSTHLLKASFSQISSVFSYAIQIETTETKQRRVNCYERGGSGGEYRLKMTFHSSLLIAELLKHFLCSSQWHTYLLLLISRHMCLSVSDKSLTDFKVKMFLFERFVLKTFLYLSLSFDVMYS